MTVSVRVRTGGVEIVQEGKGGVAVAGPDVQAGEVGERFEGQAGGRVGE
jgi:hypothetical protein